MLQLQLILNNIPIMFKRRLMVFAVLAALAAPAAARATNAIYTLTIKGQKFDVSELAVPANTKLTLLVKNLDTVPAEFESADLNREKVVVGGGTITIYVGPLAPGRYVFFDDFNPNARGTIVAK